MNRRVAFVLVVGLLWGACGDGAGSPTPSESTSTTAGPTSTVITPPSRCDYYDVPGCALFGWVLAEPMPTDDALAVVAGLAGPAIAVWRSDLACVLEVTMLPPGGPGSGTRVPSRFAYVDAAGIRERRLATSGSVAPPITGMFISESYWNHWEDQWDQAQQAGVLVEAVAVWLPADPIPPRAPAGFRAIVPVPWRRTDSIDPSYAGELLLESEEFPAGYLGEPAPVVCG